MARPGGYEGRKDDTMKKLFEQAGQARKTLAEIDPAKVAFVSEAHAAYVTEAAIMDDELNPIGHPEEVKLDFTIVAVTEENISEEEFTVIWNALDTLSLAHTDC